MKKKNRYFPLFLSLEGKRIFIAGAGKIAARRAGVLLSFGAKVFVTAPECCGEMRALLLRGAPDEEEPGKGKQKGQKEQEPGKEKLKGQEPGKRKLKEQELQEKELRDVGRRDAAAGEIVYRERRFEESDLEGMDMVLAATDDPVLNHRITELCKEKSIPVNNASCKKDCDFFFPAILHEDGLTIGVSSGGDDHKKVAETCAKLRRIFRDGV